MEDDRFGLVIYEHLPNDSSSTSTTTPDPTPSGFWRPIWVGILRAEGVEYVDHDQIQSLRLTFSDGLAMLNDIEFLKSNGAVVNDKTILADIVGFCLDKLPTKSLWGYGHGGDAQQNNNTTTPRRPSFLIETPYYVTDKITENGGLSGVAAGENPGKYSVLKNLKVSPNLFYEIERDEDALGGNMITREASTCGLVLKNILQAFRMQVGSRRRIVQNLQPRGHVRGVGHLRTPVPIRGPHPAKIARRRRCHEPHPITPFRSRTKISNSSRGSPLASSSRQNGPSPFMKMEGRPDSSRG